MFNLFLDPKKPLPTCTGGDCQNCDLKGKLVCHFKLGQLLRFLLMTLPVFIIAGIALFKVSPLLIIPWAGIIIAYFGFAEIKVMCSHCPHYAEPGTKTLKCWANYGSPKIWKYKPGPMSLPEKIVFFVGMAAVFAYPIPIIILGKSYLLLGIYLGLFTTAMVLLKVLYCGQCINFACPFNRVPAEVRESFFEKNPVIKRAWEK